MNSTFILSIWEKQYFCSVYHGLDCVGIGNLACNRGVKSCAFFWTWGCAPSEVAGLTIESFAAEGYVTVYRQKTDHTDKMELTADLLAALQAYKPFLPESGKLLRNSRLNKKLTNGRMKVRAIGSRVRALGRDILGIYELSPHDLRHTWATHMARDNSPFLLRDAGGWSNMQTSGRYVARNEVVNEGAKIDY